MLSVVLLVINVLAVVFAPQSTKLYWISTMSKSSASSTNDSLTSTSTTATTTAASTSSKSSSTTGTTIPVLSNKLQRWKSSELTSFASGSSSSATSKQKHESVAGSVIHGTFPCVWQNYNGSLITGDRAIVFTGSFFLFEKTLILPWNDIRRVEVVDNEGSMDSNVAVNGIIDIQLNDDATTVHSFFNIRWPEKVWLLLLTLHNDALLGRKASHPSSINSNGPPGMLPPDTPRLQRHNSDPSLAGQSSGSSNLFASSNSDSALTSLTTEPLPLSPCHDRPVVSTTTSMAESIAPSTIEAVTGRFKLPPIACTHAGVAGRLYTGPTAVYFTGKRYFWEHVSVTLPWSTIRHVLLTENSNDETSNVKAASGITITTKNCALQADDGGAAAADSDETTFEFNDMDSPDKVWASLIALQNECLRSIPSSSNDALNALSAPNELQPSSPLPPPPAATPVMGTAERNRRKSLRRTNSDPRTVSLNLHYDTVHNGHSSASSTVAVVAPSPVKTATALIPTVSFQSSSQTNGESISDADAWIAAITNSAKVYDNVVIDRHVLPNSSSGADTLDQYFDLFFSDTAPYSLARFLQGRGDFDLHTTTWQAAADDESISTNVVKRQTRVVQYMHPVNVPLAPPQARARKEQAVRRFGNAGLLIETETHVDDLPMTDCFYVADRIRIEPSSETNSNKTVVITMEFGITFVKSTMFRVIITRQTTSEFNALFKAMVQYMSDALINDTGTTLKDDTTTTALPADVNGRVDTDATTLPPTLLDETVPVSDQSEPKPSLSWGHSISLTPDRILLVIVLLLQLWLLFELRSIKQRLLYVSSRDDVSHNGHCSIGGV